MSFGQTLNFLLLGVVNGVIGLWLFGYAAYWFLLVLDATATGTNVVKVHWPDEPFRERLWKLGHLGFLVVFWMFPVLASCHFAELMLPPFVVLTVGVVLWLMLPLSLLASLTGETHWEVFRLTVLVRLAQRWRRWLVFYAYTFPLLFGCVLVAYLALFGWREVLEGAEATSLTWLPAVVEVWSWAFVLPLTATVAATAILIDARLLGRLAWLMDFWDEEEDSDREPKIPTANLAAGPHPLDPATPLAEVEVIPFIAEPATVAAPVQVAPGADRCIRNSRTRSRWSGVCGCAASIAFRGIAAACWRGACYRWAAWCWQCCFGFNSCSCRTDLVRGKE